MNEMTFQEWKPNLKQQDCLGHVPHSAVRASTMLSDSISLPHWPISGQAEF